MLARLAQGMAPETARPRFAERAQCAMPGGAARVQPQPFASLAQRLRRSLRTRLCSRHISRRHRRHAFCHGVVGHRRSDADTVPCAMQRSPVERAQRGRSIAHDGLAASFGVACHGQAELRGRCKAHDLHLRRTVVQPLLEQRTQLPAVVVLAAGGAGQCNAVRAAAERPYFAPELAHCRQ